MICIIKLFTKAAKGFENICKTADDVISGKLYDEDNFSLLIWQTGSGTQRNMNVNEVIKSQSSNDAYPTAILISVAMEINHYLIPALKMFHGTLKEKSLEWKDVIKNEPAAQ